MSVGCNHTHQGLLFYRLCNLFISVSGEEPKQSEFQPRVRLWKCLDKMNEVCSGEHAIIDFSLIQCGSLEDLLLKYQYLEEGWVIHVKVQYSC